MFSPWVAVILHSHFSPLEFWFGDEKVALFSWKVRPHSDPIKFYNWRDYWPEFSVKSNEKTNRNIYKPNWFELCLPRWDGFSGLFPVFWSYRPCPEEVLCPNKCPKKLHFKYYILMNADWFVCVRIIIIWHICKKFGTNLWKSISGVVHDRVVIIGKTEWIHFVFAQLIKIIFLS